MRPRGEREKRQRLSEVAREQDLVPKGDDEVGSGGDLSPDKLYFESYQNAGIHEDMINDHVRTGAYLDAINYHAPSISGKTVMDVGCGTAILSIFCARAGAARVYAIEASALAQQAKEIVKANGLDNVITVIQGRVEDIEEEIKEKVDVIVSEWMGYCLLYESMLKSVLYARDKFLQPGGLMLPSHAVIYAAPITFPERHEDGIEFWRNVYGIDMSPMIPLAKKSILGEPVVEVLTGENVLTWPAVVAQIDCGQVAIEDIARVSAKFSVSSMMSGPLSGLAVWFDVFFARSGPHRAASECPVEAGNGHGDGEGGAAEPVPSDAAKCTSGFPVAPFFGGDCRRKVLDWVGRPPGDPEAQYICLSTAPEVEPTHWCQTALYLDDPVPIRQDQVIVGSLTMSTNKKNARFLDVELTCETNGTKLAKTFVMR